MNDAGSWSLIDEAGEIAQLFHNVGRSVALDIETTGLNPRQHDIKLVQVGYDNADTVDIVDATCAPPSLFSTSLRRLTESEEVLKVGHNIGFDYGFLREKYGVGMTRVYDTMIAEKLLSAGLKRDYKLSALAKKYLDKTLDKSLQTSFADDEELTDAQLDYAAEDVKVLLPIVREQVKALKSEGLMDVARLEFEVLPVLVEASLHGVLIDRARWEEHIRHLDEIRVEIERELVDDLTPYVGEYRAQNHQDHLVGYNNKLAEYEASRAYREAAVEQLLERLYAEGLSKGDARKTVNAWKKENPPVPKPPMPKLGEGPINLGSYQQLQGALDVMGVPLPRKDGGLLKTDRLAMQLVAIDYPILEKILEWRNYQKLITAFGENILSLIDDHGRLHPEFNQLVSTGRLSCSKPNVQNIPANELGQEFRKCFVAPPDYKLLSVDYSQIELRILAELSGEPNMIEAFQNGVDLHSQTTWVMFREQLREMGVESVHEVAEKASALRKVSKMINFGIAYGLTAGGLSNRLKIPKPEAKLYIDTYFHNNPGVRRWLDRTAKQGLKDWSVSTTLGRKRYFDPIEEYQRGQKPARNPVHMPRKEEYEPSRDTQKQIASYERMMTNHPIQGSSADITKLAMVRIKKKLDASGLRAKMVFFVHDEIVLEVHDQDLEATQKMVEAEMKKAAEQVLTVVPVEVASKYDQYWSH